jgi:hypothetical protein
MLPSSFWQGYRFSQRGFFAPEQKRLGPEGEATNDMRRNISMLIDANAPQEVIRRNAKALS